ncbi:MAG: Pectate lyase superfamily protein, partial [Phycisphaerales bacterium]|nr:Pectate lyase superfamily protein [Phycisphaerales bacterium]
VTLAGEGGGTRITGPNILFILGCKQRYGDAISADHFPAIGAETGVLDKSVKDARFGLRTFDGKTRASGFFPACPLAFGYKVLSDPSGDYWKDYERGSGKPTYWQNWPQYTINLAVRNNQATPIKGVLCGVGAGGLSPELTKGNIDDPLTVWTIESDPATGNDLSFKFKVIDKDGKESVRSLPLSKAPAGEGTHRISVQLDFKTGKCEAWYGTSEKSIVQPTLASTLDLGAGLKLKAFEYGAFQLGKVTGRMFSGAPADGDWTYCGLSLFSAPRYAIDNEAAHVGAPQQQAAAGAPADDAYRFFPPESDPALVTYLPLTAAPTDLLVSCRNGHEYGGDSRGFGYWTPERKPEPIAGTITLRDVQLFASSANCGTPIAIGEASRVVLENIYEGAGGYQGVSTLPCDVANRVLEAHNCRFVGSDASLYGFDQTVHCDNVNGGGGETMFRLVGCRGWIDSVIVTSFLSCDYYVKLHAGRRGGPMRISDFCIDNEGCAYAPHKACFYAEPSLDGGPDGNRLTFPGAIYTGTLNNDQAVIELAAPPGSGVAKTAGILEVDGVDLGAEPKKQAHSIVLCRSDCWSGKVRMAETRWATLLSHGIVSYTGAGRCGIVSCHADSTSLPDKGTWLEGCHAFRIPDHLDPRTGAWVFKTYRCTRTGTYGTPVEPRWEPTAEK